ncbi:TRIC cation channel family protein [Collinsella sp. AGMB00827]|uniref:TRIC cation channel family protein n=1 Tax=Collinsella ureilytica TaxID=2869515 RepID=A0ABS7MK95_9ACTN|nr:TRIC cation channel family protein [Collinsella urealyticum]MBY4797790.1 TRIC cation channel family protein [Collinsella urealyticum]
MALFHSLPTLLAVFPHISADPVSVPVAIEMLAVIAASAAGVMSARKDDLDYVGTVGIAIACGLGGGLLRDMILQQGDVYIISQPLALPIAIGAATLTFAFPDLVERSDKSLAILDIFAVGLYAAMGAEKAMRFGHVPLICVMMGFFTAVGGGMIRDVLLNRVPVIFRQSNLYAIAAIAGAITFVGGVELVGMPKMAALILCTALTMVLRWLSLRYNILSPTEADLGRITRPLRQIGSRKTIEPITRVEQPPRSEKALDERRERVQAEIARRRSKRRGQAKSKAE